MDEKTTKQKALRLWDTGRLEKIDVGTVKGLQAIHEYLFEGLDGYEAGSIRDVNISKGNFRFASAIFLNEALKVVEQMPENTFEEIIDKYIEMNVAHLFREGNGRATRIWLDQILRKNINRCIDWSVINKNDYLHFMELSPVEGKYIKSPLKEGLTEKIDSRMVYMKGIDRYYEYEEENSISIFEIDDAEEM